MKLKLVNRTQKSLFQVSSKPFKIQNNMQTYWMYQNYQKNKKTITKIL
jgi:hypothetical protein